MGAKSKKSHGRILVQNKKAYHNYHIIQKFEAGIVLVGSEVKAIREGKFSLSDSYCQIIDGELWLINSHIGHYSKSSVFNHHPKRNRKLLMHKSEIKRLIGKLAEKNLTMVPLCAYLKNNRVKLEVALVKGKKLWDKRQSIIEKEIKREMGRKLKGY